jgi:DNA-binding IclR family transcriptional regulator
MVLSGRHAIPVVRAFSRQPLPWELAIASIFPAHASAGGKTLLSTLTEHELNDLYAGQPRIRQLTDRTIESLPSLLVQLREVRAQGYAIEDEEVQVGLRGIAVPVEDGSHRPRYALVVTGSSERLDTWRLLHLVPVLQRGARDLSACLAMEALL